MGLKGSLRNVSTGVIAIPDSGLLLDDWANDPTVSSSEITDRKSYSELEFAAEPPDESEFGPVEGRPDYTVDRGNAVVTSGYIEMDSGFICRTGMAEIDNMTWEFEFDLSQLSDSSSVLAGILFANSTETVDRTYEESYYVQHQSGGSLSLQHVDENGDFSTIILTSTATPETGTTKVTRDDEGNFELFLDGSSIGTGQDTATTTATHTGLGQRSGQEDGGRIETVMIH